MKKFLLLFGVIAALAVSSCSDEQLIESSSDAELKTGEAICGDAKVVDLIAGQHINVGTVTVSNDEENLYVTYETSGDWYLTETHVYVGDEADIPYNGAGNPRFGHFPYSESHNNLTSYTYSISLEGLDDCFAVVTHGVVDKIVNGDVVERGETAFGCGDKEFPGRRWGCYFDYCKQECEEEDDLEAYGFCHNEICFSESGFPAIGWVNGPINQKGNAFRLYAKVEGCDYENAIYVGTAYGFYNFDRKDIYVSYNLEDTNYVLTDASVYIGSTSFPLNGDGEASIDPEDFPYRALDLGGVNRYQFFIEDVPDDFYIIPHAVVKLAE